MIGNLWLYDFVFNSYEMCRNKVQKYNAACKAITANLAKIVWYFLLCHRSCLLQLLHSAHLLNGIYIRGRQIHFYLRFRELPLTSGVMTLRIAIVSLSQKKMVI